MTTPKLIIASSTDANMRYASGLSIGDPFILLDTGRAREALVSSLEIGRARKELKGKRGRKAANLERHYDAIKRELAKSPKKARGSILARIAARHLKQKRIRAVTMPANAWAIHVEQLRKEGIRVALSQGALYPERAVKRKEELKSIVKVRDATVAAMERCIEIVGESRVNARKELVYRGEKVTSERLRAEARKVLLDHGCEASEIIASHGAGSALPHEEGRGVIRAGEPILLDFFPRSSSSGYWFDMTRTVCKGAPSAELQRQWDAVREAQDAGLKLVKPGVKTGVIHKAVEDVFKRRGYTTKGEEGFIHSTGHGVGVEIHEAPSIGKGGEEVLKEGMVVTVEPGLYYRKTGGVRLEDTVLVTATGYRNLTRMERVLRL